MHNNQFIYSFLTSLFSTSIVTANLIFQKYVHLSFFGLYNFEISVGVLLYPVTFIISDLISEFFGKEYAYNTIKSGVINSIIIMLVIIACDLLPATSWSKINDHIFNHVFGVYYLAFFASLTACYIGQIIDVRIFIFLKRLTGNKHIWFRNNTSTIIAQIIDNICVLSLLYYFNVIVREKFWLIFWDNLLFKVTISICSTPFFYLGYYLIARNKAAHQEKML